MYLLDTHILLWFVNTDQRLSNQARSLISNGNNNRYLSIASLWEIAIKINLGKLTLGMSLADLRAHHIDANGIQLLPLRWIRTLLYRFTIEIPLIDLSLPRR